MLKGGRPQGFANAKAANLANVGTVTTPTLATLATIALANLQSPPANDPAPAPTTKVQADLSGPDTKGLPTTPVDGTVIDVGTVRPAGLSAMLLAASIALDAQIHAAGLLPGNDSDRWCYLTTTAKNGTELDLFTARLARFTDKGVIQSDAEALADKLVIRDRDSDDRALCLECTHLAGYGVTSWRYGNWQRADVAHRARDVQLPLDLVLQLQRCEGFIPHITSTPQGKDDDHDRY